MKHVNFPKIKQFRNIVTEITHAARFSGLDGEGNPIYNHDELPTVEFTGTVKLHGTNAGVGFDGENLWVQSRTQVVRDGHFGFVSFVKQNEEDFKKLFSVLFYRNLLPKGYKIVIYGEWCGPGIQKGVGISELPDKIFVIFGAKVVTEEEDDNYWINHSILRSTNDRIKNIFEFPVYKKDVDFSQPKMVINELIDITMEIEKECPVAKYFGVSGVGEGVVWTGTYKDNTYKFKVKGEKHSNTKVKKLVSVDPEKLQSVKETVDYLVTEQRLHQAIEVTQSPLDRKATGDVLRWLANDIISEELDTIVANGLSWKDISSSVSDAYRRMFFKMIDENL